MELAEYVEKVAAMPKNTRAYDHEDSQWKNPHVLLNKVVMRPPCGCEIDGYGTLPQPAVIRFCPTHALALEMVQEIKAILAEHSAEMHMGMDCECDLCLRRRAILISLSPDSRVTLL